MNLVAEHDCDQAGMSAGYYFRTLMLRAELHRLGVCVETVTRATEPGV